MNSPFPNPDIAHRRNLALRIERHLALLDGEKREPAPWEGYHLVDAIILLTAQSYAKGEAVMMRAELAHAFEPSGWKCPDDQRRTKDDLRTALARALKPAT